MADPTFWGTVASGIKIGAIVVGSGAGAAILYRAGLGIYDDISSRRFEARERRLTLEHVKTQNELHDIRAIPPDERGRYPLLYGKGGILRDPNNLRSFTIQTVLETWPALEKIDAVTRTVLAGGGWPAAAAQEKLLEAGQGPAVTLQPSTLDALLSKYNHRASLTNVLIGEYVDAETNTVRPLTLSIPHSVHVLCTGASGLGKSTLLEAIALQLAGLDGVQLAAIDYGSGTFDALEDALHWQIADTPDLAVALLRELIKLYQERKERYKAVGRARSLDQYNAAAGARLPFVACFLDETSALLEHDGTKGPLIEIARVGRKYGIGLILGGTDFKATTLPSEARSNCQARLAFWLEPGLSQSVLNCKDASELGGVGEIAVKKPGIVGTIRGRTPNVTEASYRVLPRARLGEVLTLDAVHAASSPSGNGKTRLVDDPGNIAQVVELHALGESDTAIAREVFGHGTSFYIERVREILQHNDSDESESGPPAQNEGGAGDLRSVVDWCEHCNRDADSVPVGVTFAACPGCGVAICSDCLADSGGALCPDCQESEGA